MAFLWMTLSFGEFVAIVSGATVAVLLPYLVFRFVTLPLRRRLTEQVVVGHLTAIVRQDLPLATALMLASRSESGMARNALQRMADLVGQGLPLSVALRTSCPGSAALVRSLVAAGERAGQVAPALQQAGEMLVARQRARARMDPTVTPYAFAVIAFTVFVIVTFLVVLVPRYEEIFMDYNARFPRSMILLISISHFAWSYGWPLTFLVIAGAALAAYLTYRPRLLPDLAWTSRLADDVRWLIPGLRRMQYSTGMAAMLPMLRHALRSGMTLPDAVHLAATVDANRNVRARMVRFGDALAAGVPLAQAATGAGLDGVTRTALGTGVRSGDMGGALRFAAEYHAAFMSRGWICLRSLAWPLCTLVLATIVGALVFTMFSPLVALLENLLETSGLA